MKEGKLIGKKGILSVGRDQRRSIGLILKYIIYKHDVVTEHNEHMQIEAFNTENNTM